MVCAAAFALRYVVDRNGAQAAADYGLALAASSVVAFFVIVAPAHWTRGVCDAIAINWVALVVDRRARACGAPAHIASERLPSGSPAWDAIGAVAAGRLRARSSRAACTALRHDGPGGVADLARARARDAAAHSADGEEPADRDRDRGVPGCAPWSPRWFCRRSPNIAAISAFSPRPRRLSSAFRHHAGRHQGLFLRDLARHAAGRGAGAASVRVRCACSSLVPRFALGLLLTPAGLSIGAIGIAQCGRASTSTRTSTARNARPVSTTASYCAAGAPAGRAGRGRIDFGPVPAGADARIRCWPRPITGSPPGSSRRTRPSRRRPMRRAASLARTRVDLRGDLRAASALGACRRGARRKPVGPASGGRRPGLARAGPASAGLSWPTAVKPQS